MGSWNKFKKIAKPTAYIAASYSYGSIPFIYLLASSENVNLKKVGSKNVGAANLWQQTTPALGALGWTLDLSKGALPPLLARRLGFSDAIRGLSAVAGVGGQCWPIFLRFDGGRGVSAILGASASLAPKEIPLVLSTMAGARILRLAPLLKNPREVNMKELMRLQETQSRLGPLSVGAAIVGLPVLAAVRNRPREVVLATAANACILLVRRLTADAGNLKDQENIASVLLYRLLYDRDTPR